MAYAPNTGSTLSLDGGAGNYGGRNKTSTSLSTNIIIKVGNVAVGAIQDIKYKETRSVTKITEVGTDGVIDSCPNKSVEVTGSCTRIRFDRLRITEAFSRSFIHLASQRYPFDIEIIDTQKSDPANQIITVVKNVWITDLDTTYNHDNWVITDTMSYTAETVFSFYPNGDPVARGGERGIDPVKRGLDASVYQIEQATDRGLNARRGSLDVSGIIDITGNLF